MLETKRAPEHSKTTMEGTSTPVGYLCSLRACGASRVLLVAMSINPLCARANRSRCSSRGSFNDGSGLSEALTIRLSITFTSISSLVPKIMGSPLLMPGACTLHATSWRDQPDDFLWCGDDC